MEITVNKEGTDPSFVEFKDIGEDPKQNGELQSGTVTSFKMS